MYKVVWAVIIVLLLLLLNSTAKVRPQEPQVTGEQDICTDERVNSARDACYVLDIINKEK